MLVEYGSKREKQDISEDPKKCLSKVMHPAELLRIWYIENLKLSNFGRLCVPFMVFLEVVEVSVDLMYNIDLMYTIGSQNKLKTKLSIQNAKLI